MDEATFQAELKNYKVVRRTDSHKSYVNKRVATNPGKSKGKARGVDSSAKTVNRPADDTAFWELIEKSSKSVLNAVELNRFLAHVRNEHSQIHKKLCLSDLESIAESLPI